jgi:hypothetical protein
MDYAVRSKVKKAKKQPTFREIDSAEEKVGDTEYCIQVVQYK